VILLRPEIQRPRVVVVDDVRTAQRPGQQVCCGVLRVGVPGREDDIHGFAKVYGDPVTDVGRNHGRIGLREYLLAELLVRGEIGLGEVCVQPRHGPHVLEQVLPRHVDLDDADPGVNRADQVLVDVAREGAPEPPVGGKDRYVHPAAGKVVGPGSDPVDTAPAGWRELHSEQQHVRPAGTHTGMPFAALERRSRGAIRKSPRTPAEYLPSWNLWTNVGPLSATARAAAGSAR